MSKVPLAKKNMFSNQIVYKRAQIVEILEIGYKNVPWVSLLVTQWHCNEATEVHNVEFVEAIVYLNPILPGIICHLSIKM